MFALKNKFLSGLTQWLQLQGLAGRENRERMRFINILQDRLKEVNTFYQGLVQKLVEKDKKGQLKTKIRKQEVIGATGKPETRETEVFSFADKKTEDEFIKEINDLYDEDFKLDKTEQNKEMLEAIKKILLDTDYKFGPKEGSSNEEKIRDIRIAREYVDWCKAFE